MARLPYRSFPKAVEFSIETLFNQVGSTGFFCISPSTWELAYSLILGYGYWRSRYYFRDPTTGELQDITDDEFTEITNIVDIAIEEFQMAGCTELTAAVDNLTAQVGLINLAVPGVGGCPCPPPAYGEITPDQQTQPDPAENPPPAGWSTWTEYFGYKCAAANRIADDYTATLKSVAGVMAGLSVINPLIFPTVMGNALQGWAAVGLMLLGFNTGNSGGTMIDALLVLRQTGLDYHDRVNELADALNADKETIVCDLFGAASAADARQALLDWQNGFYAGLGYIGGQTQTEFSTQMDRFRNNVFNAAVQNILFELDAETADYTGAVDCDECGEDIGPVIFGRLPEFPDNDEYGGSGALTLDDASRVLTSTLDENGFYYVAIKHIDHGSEFHVAYTATSLANGNGRGWAWYDWNGVANVLGDEEDGSQNPMPITEIGEDGNVSAILWIGSVSFTVTVSLDAA